MCLCVQACMRESEREEMSVRVCVCACVCVERSYLVQAITLLQFNTN